MNHIIEETDGHTVIPPRREGIVVVKPKMEYRDFDFCILRYLAYCIVVYGFGVAVGVSSGVSVGASVGVSVGASVGCPSGGVSVGVLDIASAPVSACAVLLSAGVAGDGAIVSTASCFVSSSARIDAGFSVFLDAAKKLILSPFPEENPSPSQSKYICDMIAP